MTAAAAPAAAPTAAPAPTRAVASASPAPAAALAHRAPAPDPLGPRSAGRCACGGGCPSCLADAGIQPKLLVGALDDPAEREADRVADAIVGGGPGPDVGAAPAATVQRCGDIPSVECPCHGGGEEPVTVARAAEAGHGHQPGLEHGGPAPPAVAAALTGGGHGLEPSLRNTMEARFGADFGAVRIHTDAQAAASAIAIGARAYTLGSDVVFGPGQYAPGTSSGLHILAHELSHVVQQAGGGGGVRGTPGGHRPSPAANSRPSAVVRRSGFESTVEVCHRVLESRRFKVEKGGVRVLLVLDDQDRNVPGCKDFTFGVTLTRKESWWPDDEIGTCEAETGGARQFSFGKISAGTYYLTIWRSFDHPYCCLRGDIVVHDEPVAADSSSCRRGKDLTAMDIIHGALDIAGFIPVLGAIPDGANALIYAAEGDWVNAGINAVAMIPAFGDGAKLAYKGGKEVIEASGKTIIKMGEEELAAGLKRVAKEERAATSVRRIDPEIDEMVERGIKEEEVATQGFRRSRPGAPLVRGRAEAAREAFERVRDGFAARLGVGPGGQVHHAIELQALDRYPNVFSATELNAFDNMRGIATELAGRRQFHNSWIRREWDRTYVALDEEIARLGLSPGSPAYNRLVRDFMEAGRDTIDHLGRQFTTEYRSSLTWTRLGGD